MATYLSADRKSFEFKGVALIRDSINSIHETDEKEDDAKDPPFRPKAASRTSTPKTKKRPLPKALSSQSGPDLNEFLKGHAFVKKLKLVSFDPFKEEATEWISKFETEFSKQSSVEDLGFNNVLHLIKVDEAKKWHFQYRLKYTDWCTFKRDFINHFQQFYVNKLFFLKQV